MTWDARKQHLEARRRRDPSEAELEKLTAPPSAKPEPVPTATAPAPPAAKAPVAKPAGQK